MRPNTFTTKAARAAGYRSGFEAFFAQELEFYGIPYEYESGNCKLSYTKPVMNSQCLVCGTSGECVQYHNYTVDFYLPAQGVFIETKGRFTASDRRKHELIKEQHPDFNLFILFEYDGKATPKRRYSEWCEWKGIKYGIVPQKKTKRQEGKYIPDKWLEEWGV